VHCDVIHLDAAFGEQLPNVPVGRPEPQVPAHREHDHLGWEAEAGERRARKRLRPMRGIKTMTGLRVVPAGHALVQNLRRGHYEIAADQARNLRLAIAFGQLATAI
jgi:transposase, IS6 family